MMRLLLDESTPRRLRHSLPRHEVSTVREMGWSGFKNGDLLAHAAATFDALLTVDKNLSYQQNLSRLPLAVVLLDSPSIQLRALLPLVPALEQELARLIPGTFVKVTASE